MKIIRNVPSSAIDSFAVDEENSHVWVKFVKTPNKAYKYICNIPTEFLEAYEGILDKDYSAGRFFNESVKASILTITNDWAESDEIIGEL